MYGFVVIGFLPGYPCVCVCLCVWASIQLCCVDRPLHRQVSLRPCPFRPSCPLHFGPLPPPHCAHPQQTVLPPSFALAFVRMLAIPAIAETLPATAELAEACLCPATGRQGTDPDGLLVAAAACSRNQIGESGAVALFPALARLTLLSYLHLE